jgi:hypothetical protein
MPMENAQISGIERGGVISVLIFPKEWEIFPRGA